MGIYDQACTRKALAISELPLAKIAQKLSAWFSQNHRVLPWRPNNLEHLRDPYQTWVSEVMLQQTRVESVIEHFKKWMQDFPTVQALAMADEASVLAHWQGLGYYSRARNLHKGALHILQIHQGKLPSDRATLEKVPGIGNYTAGAILSLAMHKPEPILDGNLVRIFSRLQCWTMLPTESTDWHDSYWKLARQFAKSSHPNIINEALMEYGALVCTPKQPRCAECCVQNHCKAYSQGQVGLYPPLKVKHTSTTVNGYILCFIHKGKVLIEKSTSGLLSGQWKLPLVICDALPNKAPTASFLTKHFGLQHVRDIRLIGKIRHAITHHKIELSVCEIHLTAWNLPQEISPEYAWISHDVFAHTVVNSLSHKAWKMLA